MAATSADARARGRTSCVHEVATPRDWIGDVDALRDPRHEGAPAKSYPFELDAFQRTAAAVTRAAWERARRRAHVGGEDGGRGRRLRWHFEINSE